MIHELDTPNLKSNENEAPKHVATPGQPFRLADLRPLRDRMIVQPLAESARVAGGLLHAPEMSHQREKPQKGLVIAVGPGLRSAFTGVVNPTDCRPRDVVFYGKYSGQQFDLGDIVYLNMSEIEVFTILPAGTFTVITHEKAKDWHLDGDYCDICATPEQKDAKDRLEAERAALVQAGRPPLEPISVATFAQGMREVAESQERAETDNDRASQALVEERERMRRDRIARGE